MEMVNSMKTKEFAPLLVISTYITKRNSEVTTPSY